MTPENTTENTTAPSGWGWPVASRKAHYFEGAPRSLCGKWLYTGPLNNEGAERSGPDDCAECRRRYDKAHPASAA